MTSCVVKPHYAGLFSLINNVVTCALKYDHVHVDWSDGTIYSPPGENLWDRLFVPTIPPAGEYDVIEGYQDKWLTAANVGHAYKSGGDWRDRCWHAWQKFTIETAIVSKWLEFVFVLEHFSAFHNKNAVAVLVRAHTHAGEQLSNRSQSLEEYAAAIEKEQPDAVYVACGDEQTLGWFQQRFPVIYHPETKRSLTRDIDRHLHEAQTWRDAALCLEEVLIMSCARTLIHPVSNMATGALYMNPKLRSVFLE